MIHKVTLSLKSVHTFRTIYFTSNKFTFPSQVSANKTKSLTGEYIGYLKVAGLLPWMKKCDKRENGAACIIPKMSIRSLVDFALTFNKIHTNTKKLNVPTK